MTVVNMEKVQFNGDNDCSPLNSVYCTLKMKITGQLNEKDMNKLYRCTLCNKCKTASFNQDTREKAVCNSLVMPHVFKISENIVKFGNSYGISPEFGVKEQENMETILFRGCTPTYKVPEILESAENLLKQNGIYYGIINNEECCGNILFKLGDCESGEEVVNRNIEKFKKLGVKRIITICPGCYNAFNKFYKGCNGFNPEIYLALDLLDESDVNDRNFVIQDPCHARNKVNSMRKIFKGVKNKSASPCCGAGGGLMAHDKKLALKKAKKAVDQNNERIVTYCPFCYLNLSSVNPDKTIDVYMFLNEKYNSE